MHTEEQAQDLWCPLVRSYELQGAHGGTDGWCNCIASKCAMWRWGRWQHADERVSPTEVKCGRVRLGYCGLAGKPEDAS